MNADHLIMLSEALERASDARRMATTDAWPRAWDAYEKELVARLLTCGPEEDMRRYRLQTAIETARVVRRLFEHEAGTVESLVKQLDVLEGRKKAAIA